MNSKPVLALVIVLLAITACKNNTREAEVKSVPECGQNPATDARNLKFLAPHGKYFNGADGVFLFDILINDRAEQSAIIKISREFPPEGPTYDEFQVSNSLAGKVTRQGPKIVFKTIFDFQDNQGPVELALSIDSASLRIDSFLVDEDEKNGSEIGYLSPFTDASPDFCERLFPYLEQTKSPYVSFFSREHC